MELTQAGHAVAQVASNADGKRRVAVVGLGYVGLPTALSLADAGSVVVGVDLSPARLAAISDVDGLPAYCSSSG